MSGWQGTSRYLAYLLTLALYLSTGDAFAQHSHEGKSSSVFDKYETPQVAYRVQAEVDPVQGTISGWMDISYTNLSADTLRSICLDFSHSPYDDTIQFNFHDTSYQTAFRNRVTLEKGRYCWLDSALYQAAPLSGFARMKGRQLIELPLPAPLNPGEVGPIMVAFKTQFRPLSDSLTGKSCWELIDDWFPQVAHYYDADWHPLADMETTSDHPMASYEVSLVVDSAFHLIAPGELVNQKEHYGTLPRPTGDTIAVDAASFLYAFVPEHPYRPVFANGKKKYFYRLLDGNDFDLLLTNKLQIDLADADGVPIQVIYSERSAPLYRERVAVQARKVTLALMEKYGAYPFPSVTIIALPEGSKTPSARAMIGLIPKLGGNSDIYGALARLVSRSWLADFLPTQKADSLVPFFSSLDEAFSVITAEDLVTVGSSENTIGPAQMAADNVEGWSLATPFIIERAKARLNELSLVAGRDKFSALIKELAKQHRFRLVNFDEFAAVVNATCGERGMELITQPEGNLNNKALILHQLKSNR